MSHKDTFKTNSAIRGAAYDLNCMLRGTEAEKLAVELHDSLCKAFPEEFDVPVSVTAAAADLLEALQAMVNRWEPDTTGADRRMWEAACEAIAKATSAQRSEVSHG